MGGMVQPAPATPAMNDPLGLLAQQQLFGMGMPMAGVMPGLPGFPGMPAIPAMATLSGTMSGMPPLPTMPGMMSVMPGTLVPTPTFSPSPMLTGAMPGVVG